MRRSIDCEIGIISSKQENRLQYELGHTLKYGPHLMHELLKDGRAEISSLKRLVYEHEHVPEVGA